MFLFIYLLSYSLDPSLRYVREKMTTMVGVDKVLGGEFHRAFYKCAPVVLHV